MGPLDDLDDVARALHGVLTDRRRGMCAKGSVTEPSLLYGPSASQAGIEAAVRGAAERAGREGAVLVLALIGHGSTAGQNSSLYLMATDSRADEIATAVNVGELLNQVLETPGLPGVLALVDACHAGGAIPDLRSVDGGVRQGAARLSMLMSVGAAQTAYKMAFSRAAVQVLDEGVSGAGEFLHPRTLLDAVRNLAPEQDARRVEYDGVQPGGRLWLSRNVAHPARPGPLLGPLAGEALEHALVPVGPVAALRAPVADAEALERLRTVLREETISAGTVESAWALRVVDGLLDGLRTIDLLSAWPGRPLTSQRLRRALWSAAGRCTARLPDSSGSELLRDAVEYLRLRAPRVEELDRPGSRTAPLAAFVATLAAEDDIAEADPRLIAWARDVGAEVELGDAFEAMRRRGSEMRLRLVVVMHSAVADEWPETLEAWLLDRGEKYAQAEFECRPARADVEKCLAGVVRWASLQAQRVGVRLRRVEIAASASLLLRWRPEEAYFGERLGVAHDVVLRWSERLCPPDHLWWINERARDKLEVMSKYESGRAPVDWLGEHETSQGQEAQLGERLGNGVYGRAIALEHRPQRLVQVMEVLLAYAPIVFWPESEGCLPRAFQDSLDKFWHLLPAEFSEAYRRHWGQWTQADMDGREHLARWRTVWHDTEWLDFCDWFGQFNTARGNSA
ncbi:hypothetical protein GCM10023335_86520 [Streptomyces siamensis]|uniref:vWA-MoxR associated protein middle region 2 domain-containing protein n=2 Tax=Streptomyces siamensis TaxID=1274986 RepID=A0ABP9JNU8_9ACTN